MRENQVGASDPAEVGKTRALVQVPHRSKKPEQGTVGPQIKGKPRIGLTRIGLEQNRVRLTARFFYCFERNIGVIFCFKKNIGVVRLIEKNIAIQTEH